MLLEQNQVHRRLQSCRLHNEFLVRQERLLFERLSELMADISSAETDIQATINHGSCESIRGKRLLKMI